MSDPIARSWRTTRRSLGASLLALAGLAAFETWPRWAFWQSGAGLADLTARPDSAPLRILGSRLLAGQPLSKAEIESRLSPRLAEGGYDAALGRDRAAGALIAIDGWLVPETQALAGAWLASV